MAKRKAKIREFGSPIEVRLRNALLKVASGDQRLTFSDFSTSAVPARLIDGHIDGPCADDVDPAYYEWGDGPVCFHLFGNVTIGSYRADLLIQDEHGNFTAIECDGHDWHERTKQQASADRARDRALFRLGIPTLRFTGSDIVYNDHACAVEIIEIICQISSRSDAADDRATTAHSHGFDSGLEAGKSQAADTELVNEQTRVNRGIFRGIIAELG